MPNSETSFINSFKSKSVAGWIISVLCLIGSWLIQYSGQRTHTADILAQQDRRISDLESQVKNDLATRREVDDVKDSVHRIEDKLDRELAAHGLK